jgi:RNA polymerase sigma-70 factor (ECF subfamily)
MKFRIAGVLVFVPLPEDRMRTPPYNKVRKAAERTSAAGDPEDGEQAMSDATVSTTPAPSSTPPPAEVEADQDLGLLRRAQQGDFAAFEALVDRFQPRVYGLARRILGQVQDAEDVTQQTFLSLIEHIDQFRGESAVATWVLRIATNHALKLLRKKRGLPTVPLETGADPEDSYATLPHPEFIAQWKEDPASLAEKAEMRRLLDEAVAELDERYRLVFVLRDIEGLSIRETAEALELTEANTKVRLLRARLQVRERLTRVLGDEATRVFPDHSHH